MGARLLGHRCTTATSSAAAGDHADATAIAASTWIGAADSAARTAGRALGAARRIRVGARSLGLAQWALGLDPRALGTRACGQALGRFALGAPRRRLGVC